MIILAEVLVRVLTDQVWVIFWTGGQGEGVHPASPTWIIPQRREILLPDEEMMGKWQMSKIEKLLNYFSWMRTT